MAARLLSRSKTLTHHLRPLAHGRIPPPLAAAAAAAAADLGSRKVSSYELTSPSHLFKSLHTGTQALPGGATRHHAYSVHSQFYHSAANDKFGKTVSGIKEVNGNDEPDALNGKDDSTKVIAFSPLEGTIKARASGLSYESLKIKRTELATKITYALIPALLLVSKTKLTTSLLIFSVYWQIYGFFKEIFLDYVHQEVTRKWVLVYFKLMLLILAKDMFVYFGWV